MREQIDADSPPRGDVWNDVALLARRGDAEAHFVMGYRYLRRHGLHYDKAYIWLKQAADLGHEEARHFVHQIEDEATAHHPQLKSDAEAGCATAQSSWAQVLALGEHG